MAPAPRTASGRDCEFAGGQRTGLGERELETAAFNVFLCGRMIGAAAEIDDHLNRGRNMDKPTPEAQWAHVL